MLTPPQLDPNSAIEYLKTSDYPLAATLFTLGYDIIGVDKSNQKRVLFYFKRTEEVEKILQQFIRNEIKISPLDYERSKKSIRTQMFTNYEKNT